MARARERDGRSHILHHSNGFATSLARTLLLRMERIVWYEHKGMKISDEEFLEGEADARVLGLLHLAQHIREWRGE